jgi:hypothetical protein
MKTKKMTYIKKHLLALMLVSVCGTLSFAQSTFQHTYGGSDNDNGYALVQSRDGGFLMVGYTESFGSGGKDIYAVKTDGMGEYEWSKTYGGSGDDIGWKVVSTSDSGFIIAGTSNSYNSSNADALIFKIDKQGTVDWTRSISNDSVEDAYNIIASRFGGFYITGFIHTDTMGDEAFVAKMNSSGTINWYTRIGSPGDEEGYGLAEDNQRNVIICGQTTYDSITEGGLTQSNSDAFLAKLTDKGDLTWMKTYGTTEDETAWSVAVDGNNYVFTGWTEGTFTGSKDIMYVRTDTSGRIQDNSTYSSFGDDRAFDIQPVQGSKYLITGYVNPTGANRDFLFLRVSQDGSMEAYNLIGDLNNDGHWPSEIIPTPDRGAIMFGTSNSFSTDRDFYLIKLDATGGTPCNSLFDVINEGSINYASTTFGTKKTGFKTSTPTLSSSSSSTDDSTLCCKLVANPIADTITLCKGSSVVIGGAGQQGLIYSWTEIGGNYSSSEMRPSVSPSESTKYKVVVSSKNTMCTKDSGEVYVRVVDLLTDDFISDTSFCEGDSVVLSTSAKLIAYRWLGNSVNSISPTVKIRTTDTVSLTVTDVNGCEYTDRAIVKQNDLPRFSLGKDTNVCENLGITLRGPSDMTSYNWNNGSSSGDTLFRDTDGKVTLDVVDSNGCEFSDEITVLTNPNSPFSLGQDAEFCEGSEYTIIGPGALTGFVWNGTPSASNSLTVGAPGTYWLEAYNAFGCPSYDTIELTSIPLTPLDLGGDRVLCGNESQTVSGPADMKAYLWSDQSTNQSLVISFIGTYWLQITDTNNCKNQDTIEVNAANKPIISLGNDTTICFGDSIELTPGSGFAGYSWNTGSTSEKITVKEEGEYSVEITDNNGCTATSSVQVDTTDCFGSVQTIGLTGLLVYPNPASELVHVELFSETASSIQVRIVDAKGGEVQSIQWSAKAGENRFEVPITEYASGIYWIHLYNDKGHSAFSFAKQ